MKIAEAEFPPIPGSSGTAVRHVKLAEKIANEIMTDIRTRGWPVGELLGTESDLMAKYEVSRATLGEAVRVVEAKGAVQMMRGPRGGLIVTAPALDAVVRTISNYLEFADASLDELIEAFGVIETFSVQTAAHSIDAERIGQLRALTASLDGIADPTEFSRQLMKIRLAIADASGNPAIALLMRVLVHALTQLVWRHNAPPVAVDQALRAIGGRVFAMVEAVVAGDASMAEEIVRTDLLLRVRSLTELVSHAERSGARRSEHVAETTETKAAERIARLIVEDIKDSGLQGGQKLGQELELMERYSTSRWVIRQAIRALEVHSIVRSKRGQGGGLTIGSPSPEHTVDAAQTYLHATDIPPQAFSELWHGLLGAVAQLAARRAGPDDLARLRSASVAVREAPFDAMRERQNDFYIALAETSRNRVFQLFIMIIARYLANFKVRVSQATVPEHIHDLIDGITASVAAHDEGLARRLARDLSNNIRTYVTFIDTYRPESESQDV